MAASRNGRAFLCLCGRHASASMKDVMKVASFFYINLEIAMIQALFAFQSNRYDAKSLLRLVGFVMFIAILVVGCKKDSSNPTTPQNPSDPNTISVQLTSIPQGAKIYYNGQLTDKVTPYTFSDLTAGSYTFSAALVDYDSTSHSLYLSKGDHKIIADTLSPSWKYVWTGSASYNSSSGGAKIYVWGRTLTKLIKIPQNLNAKISVDYSMSMPSGTGYGMYGYISLSKSSTVFYGTLDYSTFNSKEFTIDKSLAGKEIDYIEVGFMQNGLSSPNYQMTLSKVELRTY